MQTAAAAVASSGRAAPLYVAVRKALRLGLRIGVLGVLASASASGAGATADGRLRPKKAGLGRHTELADGYFAGSLGHGAGAEAAPGEAGAATARSRRGAPGTQREGGWPPQFGDAELGELRQNLIAPGGSEFGSTSLEESWLAGMYELVEPEHGARDPGGTEDGKATVA